MTLDFSEFVVLLTQLTFQVRPSIPLSAPRRARNTLFLDAGGFVELAGAAGLHEAARGAWKYPTNANAGDRPANAKQAKCTLFGKNKGWERAIPPQQHLHWGAWAHQRQLWSCLRLFGCPQHTHANTRAPAACPLLPGRPATFGVKSSKASPAPAAIPGHVPPQGSEKDDNSFSPICFHSACTQVVNSALCPTPQQACATAP